MKIIIINGQGGVGKDDFIRSIDKPENGIRNYSVIDPIKKLAVHFGWDGQKDEKGRRLLSDLFIFDKAHNNLAMKHIADEVAKSPKNCVIFVHIREPKDIDRFKDLIAERIASYKIATLLITRGMKKDYGNIADDGVFDYDYDYIYKRESIPNVIIRRAYDVAKVKDMILSIEAGERHVLYTNVKEG